MNVFSTAELGYLRGQALARLATAGPGGPRVKPVGFFLDEAGIVIGGAAGTGMATSRKFRDIEANPLVALVVDDVATADPWTPRGIEIVGRAETRTSGGAEVGQRLGAPFPFDPAWILVSPTRVVAWGIEGPAFQVSARSVTA